MRQDQERIKNLLIDTVTLLCKNSVQFQDQLHVEGLLGVSVDKKDVFFVHISKEFSNGTTSGDTVTQCVADSQEDSQNTEPVSEPDSVHQEPRSSAENADSVEHNERIRIKTEPQTADQEECLIVEDPKIKLEGRVSSAQVVAGQRRALKRTSTAESQLHSSDSNVSGGYGDGDSYDSVQFGEPSSKRRSHDQGDDSYLQGDSDEHGGTPWPSLAGPLGFDPSQTLQHDSDNSQIDGSQPGCSTWPAGRGVSDSASRKPSTLRKTDQVMKKFALWLLSEKRIEENKKVESLQPEVLDHHLACYLMTAKKDTGEDYEPDSLVSIHRSIERYLRDIRYPENLLTSEAFFISRQVLAKRRRDLKAKGMGKKPNKPVPMTKAQVDKLWAVSELGTSNASNLQNTVFFLLTQGFEFRPRETRYLQWGDVTLETPSDGSREYLEYNGRLRQENIGEHSKPRRRKIYATQNKRCPIEIYRIYQSHRPISMNCSDSPFFLTMKVKKYAGAESCLAGDVDWVWYSTTPLGKNSMAKIVENMARSAGLSGKIKNASLRKTAMDE